MYSIAYNTDILWNFLLFDSNLKLKKKKIIINFVYCTICSQLHIVQIYYGTLVLLISALFMPLISETRKICSD